MPLRLSVRCGRTGLRDRPTLAIALFLVWLVRSRRNAQELSPRASVPSRGWTIGAWFIPVINFFVPRQIVLDIERASSASWAQERDTRLVNLWWVAWITQALVLVGGAGGPAVDGRHKCPRHHRMDDAPSRQTPG